jgi:hypothetical protein
MSMTPYEWSQRADAAKGAPTTQLGNTAFKVTFASGYDPDYYANIQKNQGLDYDYFKTAGVISVPNAPNIPGTTAPSVTPPVTSAGDQSGTHQGSSWGLGIS